MAQVQNGMALVLEMLLLQQLLTLQQLLQQVLPMPPVFVLMFVESKCGAPPCRPVCLGTE